MHVVKKNFQLYYSRIECIECLVFLNKQYIWATRKYLTAKIHTSVRTEAKELNVPFFIQLHMETVSNVFCQVVECNWIYYLESTICPSIQCTRFIFKFKFKYWRRVFDFLVWTQRKIIKPKEYNFESKWMKRFTSIVWTENQFGQNTQTLNRPLVRIESSPLLWLNQRCTTWNQWERCEWSLGFFLLRYSYQLKRFVCLRSHINNK